MVLASLRDPGGLSHLLSTAGSIGIALDSLGHLGGVSQYKPAWPLRGLGFFMLCSLESAAQTRRS